MTRHSVLIVEDDATLLRGLKDNFGFEGYEVTTASDGEAGLEIALSREPDLVLLDIMLPGINGFEVCQRIRKARLEMPIVMLTAKGQEVDIVRGLNLGADDYVTKPFSIKELLARAQALLRRREAPSVEVYRFGSFRLDLASHQLFENGAAVQLTPKEFRLLELLLRRAGRALTRDEIMRIVWGTDVRVTTRSVDRCVTTLRSKIEPDPRHPRFILTIRDIGYRFELPEPDAAGERELVATAEDATATLPEGSRLGRYEIGKLIGSGGMGHIFQARDRHLDRDVAIKVLSRHWARHPEALARFKREARAVASLSHPSILAIFDVGTDRGLTYLVTELLHGETLRDRIRRASFDLPLAIEIGVAISGALSTAHAKSIVHRDIKPSNVFLTTDGGIRVLDFGLAQLPRPTDRRDADDSTITLSTSPGTMLGTVGYMAPEQIRGQSVDTRSDVFSLGCVLYEMVCGHGPFVRETAADTTAAILGDDRPPLTDHLPRLPDAVIRVVNRCLERRPQDRYADAGGVLTALVDASTTVRRDVG
jgi:DNA-binding response OmpR family regulator/tRNA A-37 threonylcarbamoyl transferase component Bud32